VVHHTRLRRLVQSVALALSVRGLSAAPPLHVALAVEQTTRVPASVRKDAIAEAAQIWHRYDVVVDQVVPAACDGVSMSLNVVLDREPSANEGEGGLGAVQFDPDGAPGSTVTLHLGPIARLATGTLIMGADPSLWPPKLRDAAIGRALGRALAHEVGHVLLRWPHHSASGLMRGEHRASTLADPDAKDFELTTAERARLDIVLRAYPQILAKRADGAGPITCPMKAAGN
jgi:hypothetical protein